MAASYPIIHDSAVQGAPPVRVTRFRHTKASPGNGVAVWRSRRDAVTWRRAAICKKGHFASNGFSRLNPANKF